MHSTFGQVVRKKLRRIVLSPLVFWPTLQGALLAYWCHNDIWNHWDKFAWFLLATGLGTAAYRATVGSRKQTSLAREDLRRAAKRTEAAELRSIKRKLPRDPRLEPFVVQLAAVFDRLQQVDRWRCEGLDQKGIELAEVHDQACRLYVECRNMLDRSQELFSGASQMATQDVRARVMASREELLNELRTSLEHLNRALDEVYSSQLAGPSRPISEAAELRDELCRQVEVARRVEERIEGLAGDWRHDAVRSLKAEGN